MADKLHNPSPRTIIKPASISGDFGLRISAVPSPLIADLVHFNLADVPPCEYLTQAHMHPFHQLDVVMGSWIEHRIEGWPPRRLMRGDALLIPPLIRHGMYAEEGFRHASFKIFIQTRAARQLGDHPFMFTVSSQVMKLLEAIGERHRKGGSHVGEQTMAVGALCVLEAIDAAPRESPPARRDADAFRRLIRPVLERLAEAPFTGANVADMARACHMSVDHFSKCFRAAMNVTPQSFLIETRMRIAATDLLTEPPIAIKEVADRAGYSSSQTFTRAFTAAMGISPDAFRKSARQVDDHSTPHRTALH